MARVMTAGFEAITSTRVYGMHPKLYGVVMRGKQSLCTMTRARPEHGHVLVQLQLIFSAYMVSKFLVDYNHLQCCF